MALLLLVPFFFVRIGLLSMLDKTAIRRAAHFAPMKDSEKPSYYVYQLSNIAIVIYMFFLKVKLTPSYLFFTGIAIYVVGNILLIISIVNFARPSSSGINVSGIYSISRNPMYLAYFIYFLGCVLLTQSLVLCGVVLVFQITAHWIIIAEERWCIKTFGDEYIQYMKRTRRYI